MILIPIIIALIYLSLLLNAFLSKKTNIIKNNNEEELDYIEGDDDSWYN